MAQSQYAQYEHNNLHSPAGSLEFQKLLCDLIVHDIIRTLQEHSAY